jgi:predicted GH43/DUF377 family glycosyl hydrolase
MDHHAAARQSESAEHVTAPVGSAHAVVRSPNGLRPDVTRVVGQLFVPGHALAGQLEGQASSVVAHVLTLSDDEVTAALDSIVERFGERHRGLTAMLERHARRLANRLAPNAGLSEPRRLLLGAMFTQEYAIEAVSVCNPSAVRAIDQGGLAAGELRFVLSVRQIGEGHRSSIGFRSGVIGPHGHFSIDRRGPWAIAGTIDDEVLDAALFRDLATDVDGESVQWVLEPLGSRFTSAALLERVHELEAQQDTRRDVPRTVSCLMERASRSYAVAFADTSELAERVLTPSSVVESNGLEDARFVRFVDDDGTVTYYGTYTAYNGSAIAQQLLTTTDFDAFRSTPVLGAAAANKGLALFPRRIGGRFYALSRHDGQRNAIARSDDIGYWPTSVTLDVADTAWSSVQAGNCGSPIELDEGWLVLIHGVGPMRTYSIGALLLDLDDPTVVIGQTEEPLITPRPDERDGYVPNIVYSCGALRHGDTILVPFGIADCRIGFATLTAADVLAAMSDGSVHARRPDQEVNHA